jgi:hypothetical protein
MLMSVIAIVSKLIRQPGTRALGEALSSSFRVHLWGHYFNSVFIDFSFMNTIDYVLYIRS